MAMKMKAMTRAPTRATAEDIPHNMAMKMKAMTRAPTRETNISHNEAMKMKALSGANSPQRGDEDEGS